MLIIDEAHKLSDAAMEVLRDIHDTTGIPMLLLATRDLSDRIARNADPDHGQLFSRIDIEFPLTKGTDLNTGGKPLFSLDDIRALYNEPPVRLSRDSEEYLRDVANTLGEGSLRRCKRLLQKAVRRARKRQGTAEGERVTVTADDLHCAAILTRPSLGTEQTESLRRKRAGAAILAKKQA